jgi:hypothetical protein
MASDGRSSVGPRRRAEGRRRREVGLVRVTGRNPKRSRSSDAARGREGGCLHPPVTSPPATGTAARATSDRSTGAAPAKRPAPSRSAGPGRAPTNPRAPAAGPQTIPRAPGRKVLALEPTQVGRRLLRERPVVGARDVPKEVQSAGRTSVAFAPDGPAQSAVPPFDRALRAPSVQGSFSQMDMPRPPTHHARASAGAVSLPPGRSRTGRERPRPVTARSGFRASATGPGGRR